MKYILSNVPKKTIGDKHFYSLMNLQMIVPGLSKVRTEKVLLERFKAKGFEYRYLRRDPNTNKYKASREQQSKKVDKLYLEEGLCTRIINRYRENAAVSNAKIQRTKALANSKTSRKIPKPVVPKSGFAERPPLIEMTDDMQMPDGKGGIIPMILCGERTIRKCYFRGINIQVGFLTADINDAMINPTSYFRYGKHFVYFMVDGEKELYLTYYAVQRFLVAANSESNTAENFSDWTCELVFTAKYGTKEAKQELAAKIVGISPKVLRSIFPSDSESLPCIYLARIGGAKFARNNGITIRVGKHVYKFGYTDNLARRMSEHEADYGKMADTDIEVVYYMYIDPSYLKEAEDYVRKLFQRDHQKFVLEKRRELVVLTDDQVNSVKKEYDICGKLYRGRVTEIYQQLEDLKKKYDLCVKDGELKERNAQIKCNATHKKEMGDLKKEHKKEVDDLKKEHKEELEKNNKKHVRDVKKVEEQLSECKEEKKELKEELKELKKEFAAYKASSKKKINKLKTSIVEIEDDE
jgi:hypothetical protein